MICKYHWFPFLGPLEPRNDLSMCSGPKRGTERELESRKLRKSGLRTLADTPLTHPITHPPTHTHTHTHISYPPPPTSLPSLDSSEPWAKDADKAAQASRRKQSAQMAGVGEHHLGSELPGQVLPLPPHGECLSPPPSTCGESLLLSPTFARK